MYQYCTLQEAYNVPTFSRKKKGCLPMEPNASAEPYDPFTEQKGREQAALVERFENASKPQAKQDQFGLGGDKVTYKSMETDYDYYCKNYNICPLEKFTNAKEKKKDTCTPLSPSNYEYPISEEDKAKFQKALKIALENMENPNPSPSSIPKKEPLPSNSDVTGFVDEELESYMKVHEMKAVPKPPTVPQPPPKELPGFDPYGSKTPFEKDTQKHLGYTFPKNFTQANAHWMDLLLFIVSGLLIIFLLEQMYKVTLMIGMKRTLQAMDHLMQTAKEQA